MSSHLCNVCGRSFSSTHHYMSHFKYKKGRRCMLDFQKRLRVLSPLEPSPKRARIIDTENEQDTTSSAQRPLNFGDHTSYLMQQQQQKQQQQENNECEYANDLPMEDDAPPIPPVESSDSSDNDDEEGDESSKIMDDFKTFVNDSVKNRSWLDHDMQAAIELMHLLQKNGAPLTLYDTLMDWHLGHLATQKRVTRGQLFEKLRKRYNMVGCQPYIARVRLPSSGVKARVPCNDAWSMLSDLLTDPRITPDDYLWFNDDPLGQPPPEWLEMADINDGLAYRKTHEKEIMPRPYTESGRRRVLLPVLGYMDGCVTGFNENLSIEIFKFTLGIFKSNARDKDYTWRNLGAVPQHKKVRAKAAELIDKSGHFDASGYLSLSESEGEDTLNVRKFTREFEFGRYIDSSDDESEICNVQLPETPAQDLHVILQVIMSKMKKIFEMDGFEWDLHYKGHVYKLQFIPFMLFMKGNTVEHDKHTGRYGSRNRGVKSLCRYCVCPDTEIDNPYIDYPRKGPEMMTELIRKKDMEGLKDISQSYIFNMWYEFGFGLHNKLNIHGACPMELLHWIQLGMYKYSRSMLFEQLGQYSELGDKINTIGSEMGWLFQRKSDRDLPRTKFTKGVQKGVLMAHEMTGVMLVLVATLRCTQAREAILAESKEHFGRIEDISNWITLLETQLQFENWLKSAKMSVADVIRFRTKARELMEYTKAVGKRQKGMKFKTNNFHSTKHVPDDILMFGPPHTVDTRPNEMHHKPDKKSAKMTQKRPDNFDLQATERIEDRRVIENAMEELKGRPKWDYFRGFDRPNQHRSERVFSASQPKSPTETKNNNNQPSLTGVQSDFEYSQEKEGYVYTVHSNMRRKSRYRYPKCIVGAIADLVESIGEYVTQLTVYSEIEMPNGQLYRASPFFQGKPWYDWAMCRVGPQIEGFEERILPVHIRGFIDLDFLPDNNDTPYAPGLHMICETTRLNPDVEEIQMSDIMVPYLKEEGQHTPNRVRILPVADIRGPTCLLPDLAHPTKRAYLRVRPMSEWNTLFQRWLNSPHLREHQEPGIGC